MVTFKMCINQPPNNQMVTFKMCINLRNNSKNLAQFKK